MLFNTGVFMPFSVFWEKGIFIFAGSIICVTMRDWTQMICSMIKNFERKLLSMLKKSLSKSTLMTALITGSVIWGGTR